MLYTTAVLILYLLKVLYLINMCEVLIGYLKEQLTQTIENVVIYSPPANGKYLHHFLSYL